MGEELPRLRLAFVILLEQEDIGIMNLDILAGLEEMLSSTPLTLEFFFLRMTRRFIILEVSESIPGSCFGLTIVFDLRT